jgi:hypothetical protein
MRIMLVMEIDIPNWKAARVGNQTNVLIWGSEKARYCILLFDLISVGTFPVWSQVYSWLVMHTFTAHEWDSNWSLLHHHGPKHPDASYRPRPMQSHRLDYWRESEQDSKSEREGWDSRRSTVLLGFGEIRRKELLDSLVLERPSEKNLSGLLVVLFRLR